MAKPNITKRVRDYTIRLKEKLPSKLASNTRPWHSDPITERQTRFLQFFDAPIPQTKGEAFRMIARIRLNPQNKNRLKEYEKSKLPLPESDSTLSVRILKGSFHIAWKAIVWIFKRRSRK